MKYFDENQVSQILYSALKAADIDPLQNDGRDRAYQEGIEADERRRQEKIDREAEIWARGAIADVLNSTRAQPRLPRPTYDLIPTQRVYTTPTPTPEFVPVFVPTFDARSGDATPTPTPGVYNTKSTPQNGDNQMPNRKLGPPDVIYMNAPDADPGFLCPTGDSTCLSSIPRADVTQTNALVIDGNLESKEVSVDLDAVRGMTFEKICGLVTVQVDPAADPAPTVQEQAQFYQILFFAGEWSLTFRGQDVPGFTKRPIGDIAGEPGCCNAPCIPVGCKVPDYGAMTMKFSVPGGLPAWAAWIQLSTRATFTGCPKPSGRGCGCGCGSSGSCGAGQRVTNPYIVNYAEMLGGVVEGGTGGEGGTQP